MNSDGRAPTPRGPRGLFAIARGISPLIAVLAVPFLLRPRDNLLAGSGENIVVITPHSGPLRYEFSRAFREHMKKSGRSVWIDWRTPGSSREISRFIAAEYVTAFASHWKTHVGRAWSSRIEASFADPRLAVDGAGIDPEAALARRTFLQSNVGIGIDLLFGTGALETASHAAAGRLVDAGLLRSRAELFGESGIPETTGGKVLWDSGGRWFGACLTRFGICYNGDSLARLGVGQPPTGWSDLADPRLFGQLAIADPTKSGAAASAFEMVIHEQMNRRLDEIRREGAGADVAEARAPSEGWDRAMRLVRRIAANARYFSSQGTQTALDIAMGDAAAGMCIDFYGRFQSEAAGSGSGRVGFVSPRGGTAIDTDPIALLRGAPHRDLAVQFMSFVLSAEGQKLWNFRIGTAGGPERHALRRLPILPELYSPSFAASRSDPGDNPYEEARAFTYRAGWIGPLFPTITFILKTTCLDAHDELAAAYRALAGAGFPPRATALFDDVHLVDHAAAAGPIKSALSSGDPVGEARFGSRLTEAVRAQYRRVAAIAAAEAAGAP